MADHPNVELLRDVYGAYSTGDLDALRNLFPGEIVLHVPGRSPISGDRRGKDEVIGFLGSILGGTGGTTGLVLDVHEILANDTHGVALLTGTASRDDGRELHGNFVHVWHFARRKPTEVWVHPYDLYESDEFWA